jgi:hypothetical protein
MTERTQKILKTFLREPKFSKRNEISALTNVLREIANCFEWDSYGLAELCADDFNEIADELEAL